MRDTEVLGGIFASQGLRLEVIHSDCVIAERSGPTVALQLGWSMAEVALAVRSLRDRSQVAVPWVIHGLGW